MTKALEWLSTWVGKLSTTNLRIFVTIIAFVLVTMVWLGLAILHSFFPDVQTWEPSGSMIAFLSVWAALDVAQFTAKRTTQDEEKNPTTVQNMKAPPDA